MHWLGAGREIGAGIVGAAARCLVAVGGFRWRSSVDGLVLRNGLVHDVEDVCSSRSVMSVICGAHMMASAMMPIYA
eukprot:662395-Pyramimonas_sp.AAC.1